MKNDISFTKIRIVFLTLALSCLLAYKGQPLIHGNDQAVNLLVTVFSILAGFLVAIIAIIGDPALLPPGSWRAAEMERERLDNRLVRHKWLFISYLSTLFLVFVSLLFGKSTSGYNIWVERFALLFASFSFMLSLQLPWVLIRAQRERIDSVIEHRRRQEGIEP